MKCIVMLLLVLGAVLPRAVRAEGNDSEALPFNRAVINRYSLDHLPRSISIRQGPDVWLGYDLEQGKLYKAWQATDGESGLKSSGFRVRSAGKSWYEDKSEETWQLRRKGKEIPLSVRYLGCTQRDGYFELRWELRHDGGCLTLLERVPANADGPTERVRRDLQVEPLDAAEELLLPRSTLKSWEMTKEGASVTTLAGTGWHRLSLP